MNIMCQAAEEELRILCEADVRRYGNVFEIKGNHQDIIKMVGFSFFVYIYVLWVPVDHIFRILTQLYRRSRIY